MRMRRAILFASPACLYALGVACVAMWIREIKVHTAFTDAAASFLAMCLFFAFPVAICIMWLAGRKGEFRRFDKPIAWVSVLPLLLPWGFVCWVMLIMLTWRGD